MFWGQSTKRKSPVSITTSSTSSQDSTGETYVRPRPTTMGGSDVDRDTHSSRGVENDLSAMRRAAPAAASKPMKRPTLEDILSDKALSPWTLKAFNSWCGKNMCAENLNFVTDARAYQRNYSAWRTEHPDDTPESSSDERAFQLNGMWKGMIKEYITPNGLQEVNLSANVRDNLATIAESQIPPAPDVLQPAVRQIRGLLEDSILMSFLNEMQPPGTELGQAEPPPNRSAPPRAPQIAPAQASKSGSAPATKVSKRSEIISPPPSRKGFFHHVSTGSVPSTPGEPLPNTDTAQSMSALSATNTHSSTYRSESPSGSGSANLSHRDRRPSPWSRNDATWKKLSLKLGLKKKPSGGHLSSGENAVEEDDESPQT